MDPDLLAALQAFTSADRLRILGALAARSRTSAELAAELGRPIGRIERDVALLRRAGLVAFDRDAATPAHALAPTRLAELGRALDALALDAHDRPGTEPDRTWPGRTREDVKVLRAFFEAGRLTSIPAAASRRAVVLREIRDRCFPEDRPYPEKEVNQLLALIHPDVAALRRYLVDGGLMTRASGVYRRPPVDLDAGSDQAAGNPTTLRG